MTAARDVCPLLTIGAGGTTNRSETDLNVEMQPGAGYRELLWEWIWCHTLNSGAWPESLHKHSAVNSLSALLGFSPQILVSSDGKSNTKRIK